VKRPNSKPPGLRPPLRLLRVEPDFDAVAEAVHQAIGEAMGTDGFGLSRLYAALGYALLVGFHEAADYNLHAGFLYLFPDPDNRPLDWYAHPQYPWIVGPGGVRIDLAARHYPRMVTQAPDPLTWHRPPPPTYLSYADADQPGWVTHAAIGAPTLALREHVTTNFPKHVKIIARGGLHYRRLTGLNVSA
jgi:hypothetical protein